MIIGFAVKILLLMKIMVSMFTIIDKYFFSHLRIKSNKKNNGILNIEDDNYHKVRFPTKKNKRISQIINETGDQTDEQTGDQTDENNYDVIIIGSGIGSLTTAALLAKSGKRVVVLEQHSIAGGTTHSFIDRGVEHEVGLHYIGNIHKLKKVFDIITEEDTVEWCKMGHENPDGRMIYDEIHIADKSYYFEAGRENLITYLKTKFPDEEKAIDDYFSIVQQAAKKDLFFMLKVFPWRWISHFIRYIDPDYYKYVSMSVTDVLSKLTKNKELISVLCGQYGDYGILPSKASFFFHASVVNHYLDGGWFPRGGTSIIAKKICKTIFKNGGCVFVNCGVKQILTETKTDILKRPEYRAYGVKLDNDVIIKASQVVSGVGIRNTFDKLLTTDIIGSRHNDNNKIYNTPLYRLPVDSRPYGIDAYKKIMDNIKPSVQHIYCFVKIRGNPASLGLRSSNLWIYPHGDYDKIEKEFLESPLDAPMPMFMGFSCVKDDKWSETYPGFSNAIILTLAKKEWFSEWENKRCGKRGDVYNDYKDRIGERMLEEGLYKFFPKTRNCVEHFEMATPLTTQYYLGASDGESYGLDINRYRLLNAVDLRPKTSINGLYLTGQDICTLGVSGALNAGVMTACVMMDYDNIADIAFGNNIVDDLYQHKRMEHIKKN